MARFQKGCIIAYIVLIASFFLSQSVNKVVLTGVWMIMICWHVNLQIGSWFLNNTVSFMHEVNRGICLLFPSISALTSLLWVKTQDWSVINV
jgi:hypothetical protein